MKSHCELSVHQEHKLLSRLEAAGLGSKEAQAVIESPDNWLAAKVVAFIRHNIDWLVLIQHWKKCYQRFYKEVFEWTLDFSQVPNPAYEEGFARLLIVAKGVMPEALFQKCKELFPCLKWTDDDLDEITTSDRSSKDGHYAIWVRDRVEADEELRNISADDLKKKGIPGITLEERFLLELKYFKETGKHLDLYNHTLCAGSRDSHGNVPVVYWDGCQLCVSLVSPSYTNDGFRSRLVII